MNRAFDFYEYAGVIVPGAVLTLGLLWLFPEGRLFFAKEGVTFGELGLFVIIAYAAGQLVQAIGNYIESVWWKLWGGMPSKQVLAGACITPDQHKRILAILQSELKEADPSGLSSDQCSALIREVYSSVAAAGKAGRIDTFNGNYGLLRGLAASLFTLIVAATVSVKSIYIIAGLIFLFFLALQRMHRFGRHYAIELFIQFLTIRDKRA